MEPSIAHFFTSGLLQLAFPLLLNNLFQLVFSSGTLISFPDLKTTSVWLECLYFPSTDGPIKGYYLTYLVSPIAVSC